MNDISTELIVNLKQQSMCTIPLEEYEELNNELIRYKEMYANLYKKFYDYKMGDFINMVDQKTIKYFEDPETNRITISGELKVDRTDNMGYNEEGTGV